MYTRCRQLTHCCESTLTVKKPLKSVVVGPKSQLFMENIEGYFY